MGLMSANMVAGSNSPAAVKVDLDSVECEFCPSLFKNVSEDNHF